MIGFCFARPFEGGDAVSRVSTFIAGFLFGLAGRRDCRCMHSVRLKIRHAVLCLAAVFSVALVSGCTTPSKVNNIAQKNAHNLSLEKLKAEGVGREVVMYALGLLDVGYQFGGSNPEAGLDCSGMVRFVYKEAVGVDLPHSAAALAHQARPVINTNLQAGDLVFFNTSGYPYSHVGIYLGDNKFVHAPSSRGRVRVESLDSPYFARRFQGGRTLFDGG